MEGFVESEGRGRLLEGKGGKVLYINCLGGQIVWQYISLILFL